jgi:uroporphyrinogen III methyltransferase / synthase
LERASHPLAGKRIVVTRAREQAHDFIQYLREMGAEVLLMPTVAFAPPDDWAPVDAALQQSAQFDWVLFTSRNAVGFFCQRWRELELDLDLFQLAKPLIAAVGPATAQVASENGLRVDYVAKANTGKALAAEMRLSLSGKSVLLPRSDRADDRLPDALREAGAFVTTVVAYRTSAPESLDPEILARLRLAEVDAISFASPSAFHNLARFIGSSEELASLSQRVPFAAIGPTTARALRDAGVRVAMEAVEPSPACLADAISKYYERQSSTAGDA